MAIGIKTFKKGSKSIRKIMADRGPVDTYKIKSLVSFSRIVDINIQRFEITLLKQQLNLWTYPNIRNDIREFAFKFYNNLLGINTRVAHFVAGYSRACTFCVLKNVLNRDETFSHLFLECDQLNGLRNNLLREFFSDNNLDPNTVKNIWLGLPPPPK
jgi:hypothetical protein